MIEEVCRQELLYEFKQWMKLRQPKMPDDELCNFFGHENFTPTLAKWAVAQPEETPTAAEAFYAGMLFGYDLHSFVNQKRH